MSRADRRQRRGHRRADRLPRLRGLPGVRGRIAPRRGSLSTLRAIAFDLNGTLSHDEELYFEIFAELFEREGRPVTRREYFQELVGNADPALVRRWLGDDFARIDELLAERIERFLHLAADGRTVPAHTRDAVRKAAETLPVAVVSGAFRVEVDGILRGAGLATLLATVVALEDVTRPKPDPEAYLVAAGRLGVEPCRMLAFEDTAVGIAAAKTAGLRCIAVLGSQPAGLLAEADEVVERLDAALIERLVARS
ncbi:MAG: HAD family phosphatase [Gaiellales bacterium]